MGYWEIFDFQCIYLTKLEYRPSLKSLRTFIMINSVSVYLWQLAKYTLILVIALGIHYFSSSCQKNKLTWTISYSNKA